MQGKPHCFGPGDKPDGYVNIFSFDPGLNETLSPVSSAPQHVCLCDSNGKPQCANISYIFTNTSVYRGETITLPACIVGYDFGTTVGTIHARSLYSYSHSKRYKSQPVINSEKCVPFNYTIYSKLDYELLLLQTSSLPVSVFISNESTQQDIFYYKYTINDGISLYFSHNQSGCIYPELLTTSIFINITLLPGCPPRLTLVPARTTLAWQLDLLGALNTPTVITWRSCLPLVLLVSSLCSLSLYSTSLSLKDSLMESSSMLTLYGPIK